MWKGVLDRPLALGAVAGLFLLVEAVRTTLAGGPETVVEAAAQRLFEGGEGSVNAAVDGARKALESSPASPHRWCDMAEAFLEAGDGERAGRCFRRAEHLGPAVPEVLLRSFYGAARQRREQDKVRLAHTILGMVRTYDDVVYGLYLSSDRSLTENLESGFPTAAAPSFLRFITDRGEFDSAAGLWRWMAERGIASESSAIGYLDALCQAGRRPEARQIWARFTGTPGEWVWNGGWELDRPAGKVDWELNAPGQSRISRDCTRAGEGRCSLRITADWPDSRFFEGVEQRVALPAGAYRMSALLRGEAVTGTGFGIRAAGDGFDVRSAGVADSAGEWRRVAVDFRVKVAGEVRIQVMRPPGTGVESNAAGTVWVDAVRITPGN